MRQWNQEKQAEASFPARADEKVKIQISAGRRGVETIARQGGYQLDGPPAPEAGPGRTRSTGIKCHTDRISATTALPGLAHDIPKQCVPG